MSCMNITRKEAYKVLELPPGADKDSIRTSYKRIAPKFLPDKHRNTEDALKKFQRITLAYKCLNSLNDSCTITLEETFDIYRSTFKPNSHPNVKLKNGYSKFSSDSDCSSTSDDDDEDDDDDCVNEMLTDTVLSMLGRGAMKSRSRRELSNDLEDMEESNHLTVEQREQVANELISEEEKKKKKLEKRRAKKKQRREKKRLEKLAADDPKNNDQQKNGLKHSNGVQSAKVPNGNASLNLTNNSGNKNDINGSTNGVKKLSEENNNKRLEVMASRDHDKAQINGATDDENFIRSRRFAIEGNTLASLERYPEAITCFTNAIHLNSMEYRYFGNRAYCFEKNNELEKSLEDADTSIRLAPEWPKGYFRRGIALARLMQYTKAEESFREVLRLDNKCEDAKIELHRIQVVQLMNMGFNRSVAEKAASKCDSLQQALDLLLSGIEKVAVSHSENSDDLRNGCISSSSSSPASQKIQADNQQDGDWILKTAANEVSVQSKTDIKSFESNFKSGPQGDNSAIQKLSKGKQKKGPLLPIPQHHYEEAQRNIQLNQLHLDDVKMNPRNPEGLKSIWVGNVLPDVPQDEFRQLFEQYGKLQGIRFMPDKFCAFVNFVETEAAGNAMHHLQGYECRGQHLLIKFPDHPVDSTSNKSEKHEVYVASKPAAGVKLVAPVKAVASTKPPVAAAVLKAAISVKPQQSMKVAGVSKPEKINGSKVTGPVNGNECYFWRTTGCQFSENCRFLHLPENKGIDKKPWHKPK